MNLRIITKNHAADPEKGFLTKSVSKPNSRTTAKPPAWELRARAFGGVELFLFLPAFFLPSFCEAVDPRTAKNNNQRRPSISVTFQ